MGAPARNKAATTRPNEETQKIAVQLRFFEARKPSQNEVNVEREVNHSLWAGPGRLNKRRREREKEREIEEDERKQKDNKQPAGRMCPVGTP